MQSQTHITLPIEQFNLLMEMVCAMQSKIDTIEAKTDNIHRIFAKVNEEPNPKKLSLKQKRAKAFKDAVDKENADLLRQINQM